MRLTFNDEDFKRLTELKKRVKSKSWELFFLQLINDKEFWSNIA